ncbi:MAG: hypothetical protein P2A85_21935 [Microcoleus anatoxicus]|uniref:hypothetical protein n=1 Tax=Microcoleus anatoxicus TaxID=2705319 RepID=UPI00366AFDBD
MMKTNVDQGNSESIAQKVVGVILGYMLRTKVKRVSLSGGIVASVLCLVSPVQALQVQVTPANPELGDVCRS